MKKSEKIRFSLKFKFILGIVSLVGLIIALTSVETSIREVTLITESMDRSGLLLSSTLALACQDPIVSNAFDELIPYTERIISGDEDVKEITIIDRDGKCVGHRLRGEGESLFNKVLPPEKTKKYESLETRTKFSEPGGNTVEYVAPVRIGATPFGTVILRYSLDRLNATAAAARKRVALISLVALLAGIVLSVLLAHFITSGLDTLVKGTQNISAGDLTYRIAIPTMDEIGMLASRFNEMVSALEGNRQDLDRKIFEIETLFKASQAMNFQSDTEKLIRQILEMASKALKSERASIMILTDQTNELVTKIVFGIDENVGEPVSVGVTRIKMGEGVAGMVLKTGQTIVVNEGFQDPLFKSFDSTASFEQSIRNLISVPLKIRERVTGVINIVNKIGGTGFDSNDQRLIEALAQQAAMAVEHARLYELAITDGLTRLYIHRYFQARLEEEILRAKRYHTMVSLILFDIDHFKKFNDTYGHQQGDMVLMEVARLIKQTVRDTVDIPARYGGEEFTIILPETDAKGAQLVAERLRKTVESHDFPGQGQTLKVTVSLGISSFPDHATSKALLIRKADLALYTCKKKGRNCSSVYNETMQEM